MTQMYDLLVVGAGIVGLAHAYEATKRGLKVAVVEKDAQCVGASIRNFGFVTVSGQSAKDTWRRAVYASEQWALIAPQAGIDIIHRGSWVVCQRPEAVCVAQAFLKTTMGRDCQFFSKDQYPELPALGHANTDNLNLGSSLGLLYSPHEFRVESREAIPQLAAWLASACDVDFFWGMEVLSIDGMRVNTPAQQFLAQRVVICPGAAIHGIEKPYLSHHDLKLCTLQMLRIRPDAQFVLPGSVMTDNSLARYLGWSELPEAVALKQVIRNEMPEYIAEGIHLIAVQSADGSLVVGDSHRYGRSEQVFSSEHIDRLIIQLLQQTLRITRCDIVERWSGVYLSSDVEDAIIEAVSPTLRVAVVSSGTGASTAFGLASDNLDDWLRSTT